MEISDLDHQSPLLFDSIEISDGDKEQPRFPLLFDVIDISDTDEEKLNSPLLFETIEISDSDEEKQGSTDVRMSGESSRKVRRRSFCLQEWSFLTRTRMKGRIKRDSLLG